jgi:hypothetical protein
MGTSNLTLGTRALLSLSQFRGRPVSLVHAKQSKTKQSKAKQSKAKQSDFGAKYEPISKAKHSKAKQSKAKQSKANAF